MWLKQQQQQQKTSPVSILDEVGVLLPLELTSLRSLVPLTLERQNWFF